MRGQDVRNHSGRCRDWIKVKNPAHPAIESAMLIALVNAEPKRNLSVFANN
jgi:hypothetical protein